MLALQLNNFFIVDQNSPKKTKKIVIFASGNGTNAVNIFNYFKSYEDIEVTHIFSNKRDAKVLERANRLGITPVCFTKSAFSKTDEVLILLKEIKPDLIVLAGFLLKIPQSIIDAFPDRIINIHPSLLPKYGGKGMYGSKVHETVIANKEVKSGISIHYVNPIYDDGKIISQHEISVSESDTPESLAEKIHELEYKYFPQVIHQILSS
ncbi:phosphoribosylglycinamide formyltransferase-1 [Psychroflexus halocasei]|uniref:Phosphoribosylglycinamide formyltransferase n=1 Tax=Psychroflexus halocasei TaxID=908615 RepID=A0A1H3W1V9_9FLAO|nr:phosphoribosylglycinamide formyltransferase-1 [Psychroflexus halocasei]